MAEYASGPGDSGGTRGVYWKRNDSMRLVHLLIDPELKARARPGPSAPHARMAGRRADVRACAREEHGGGAPD